MISTSPMPLWWQVVHSRKFNLILLALPLTLILNGCDQVSQPSLSTSSAVPVEYMPGNDMIPPSAPSFASPIDVSDQTVSITWAAAQDNSVVDLYEVYLDGHLVGETEETQFTFTQLKPNTTYNVSIKSVDDSDNKSLDAVSLNFTTLPKSNYFNLVTVDTEAPSNPVDLRATNVARDQVTLYWTPSTDNIDVVNYRIYSQQQLVKEVSDSKTLIDGLNPETTYSFNIQAVDAAGNASGLSNTLQVITSGAFGALALGVDIYTTDCASCHGANGLGVGTTIGVTRAMSLVELTTIIELTMPTADPTLCVADCASNVAQYIFDNFTTAEPVQTDPLAGFPPAGQLLSEICARARAQNRSDVVVDTFCGATAPQITSLTNLRSLLGLSFNAPNATGRGANGTGGNPSFAITGHSSSLVAKEVNAINPRAIVFTANNNGRRRGGGAAVPNGFVATGFVRGDQLVEIIAADRNNNNALNFYLLRFENPCNATNSCTQGDLLTPATETNWTATTLFDQVNLANTTLDCLHCHQPGGPTTQANLLMQELANPWSHWFRSNTASNVLIDDFRAAKGTAEGYAGIPANLISASDPRLLENLVRGTGVNQNTFNSRAIQREILGSNPAQPANNTIPGVSNTWNNLNARTIAGQSIAVPYHDIKVTDPAVLPQMVQSYQSLLSGALTTSALPNLRDAFYTAQLRDIGFKVAAGLDGAGIITQACSQCHNSNLNQTITRARFNVNLNEMSNVDSTGVVSGLLTGADRDAEIGRAIVRLQLAHEDIRVMPPKGFRVLDAAEINLAIGYLCSQTTGAIGQCAGR